MRPESLYLSQLLGSKVVDSAGATPGWIADVVARQGDLFPLVVALVVRRMGARALYVPWDCVREAAIRRVALRVDAASIPPYSLQDGDIFLGAEVLDKQIVDTQGRRVIKVNDLKLVTIHDALRVVGVDVGIRGLLRRIGAEAASERAARLVRKSLPEALIPWSYVETIPTRGASVRLTVPFSRLERLHPADIGRIISQLPAEGRVAAVERFSDATIAETMGDLDASTQLSIMEELDNQRASDILERMAPDEATDLLQDLPEQRQAELLTLMESDEAAELTHLLGYDERTAGGLMTTEFIAIPGDLTAQEAIARVRKASPDAETIYYLYVTDGEGRLAGVISLFNLITSPPDRPISERMSPAVVSAPTAMDQEDVAALMAKYRLLALPVVAEDGRLLGIITVDDTIDVVDEEAEEDVSRIAGTPTETLEELQSSPSVALNRAPWLLLALTAGLFSASALHSLAGPSLSGAVLFLPLMLFLGNQAAARAAGATARAIALHQVDRRNWWTHSLAELRLSALVALAAAGAAGLVAGLWSGWVLGMVVGCSIATIGVAASVLGLLVPLAEAALSLDPAIALRPIMVSLLSVVAPIIYAGFLRAFLH